MGRVLQWGVVPVMLAAAACFDTGTIGESYVASPVIADESAPSVAPIDAGIVDERSCHDDCAARGKVCDPGLGMCVACLPGRCSRDPSAGDGPGPGPGCDPQRGDCFRCWDGSNCPVGAPWCVEGVCRRCPERERVPVCDPRFPWECSDRPCGPDFPGSPRDRGREDRDFQNMPDAGH